MPEGFDVHVKTQAQGISVLCTGKVTHFDFDHDLGAPVVHGNGHKIANWIETHAENGMLPRLTWHIHSGNAVGRDNIKAAMRSAERQWDKREENE